MTAPARDWLPLAAFNRASLRAVVDGAIEAWAGAWLGTRCLGIVGWSPQAGDRRDDTDGAGWRARPTGMAMSMSRRARSRLLGWALGVGLDEVSQTDVDRQVLHGLEQRMVDDLFDRLEAKLGTAATLPSASVAGEALPAGGVVVGLGEGAGAGGALFSIALPVERLLPLMRSTLPAARRATAALQSRRLAVSSQPVQLAVRLGAAELSLAEAQNLAPGDVLVLDRSIAVGVELVLAGDGRRVAQAKLAAADGSARLTIQSLES